MASIKELLMRMGLLDKPKVRQLQYQAVPQFDEMFTRQDEPPPEEDTSLSLYSPSFINPNTMVPVISDEPISGEEQARRDARNMSIMRNVNIADGMDPRISLDPKTFNPDFSLPEAIPNEDEQRRFDQATKAMNILKRRGAKKTRL